MHSRLEGVEVKVGKSSDMAASTACDTFSDSSVMPMVSLCGPEVSGRFLQLSKSGKYLDADELVIFVQGLGSHWSLSLVPIFKLLIKWFIYS